VTGRGEGVSDRGAKKLGIKIMSMGVAVVKVTPSVGCVKYKALPIVLPVRIPVLMRGKWPQGAKNGAFSCGFSLKGAKFLGFTGGYWSVIGHRLRVGPEGRKEQGAGVVQCMWIGVEMWERGCVRTKPIGQMISHLPF
jgi:hypothetical protein